MLYEGPKRLWYTGPMFRHERPQRGRYRQFHQLGIEALGFAGPDIDAEIILMCQRLWDDLGLSGIKLELNSLGQANERAAHREALIEHFKKHESELDEDSKRRLVTNPLRILDSKNPAMKAIVESAPQILNYLGEESLKHFEGVQKLLKANNLPFKINPRLVRGLDYYNLTVFEWVTERLGSQGTVCGGGRYDTLIEQLGGKPAPAVGWGLGIERLLLLLQEAGIGAPAVAPDAYAVVPSPATMPIALRTLDALRAAGVSVLMHAAGRDGLGSMKSQFKRADASGARHALIFGDEEVARGEVAVKPLREASAAQHTRVLSDAALWADELRTA
jgi:histidyl-tRNA synthetase